MEGSMRHRKKGKSIGTDCQGRWWIPHPWGVQGWKTWHLVLCFGWQGGDQKLDWMTSDVFSNLNEGWKGRLKGTVLSTGHKTGCSAKGIALIFAFTFTAARPLQLTPLPEQQGYPFVTHAATLTSWDTRDQNRSRGEKVDFVFLTALSAVVDNVKLCKQGSAGQTDVCSAVVSAFRCSTVHWLHFSYGSENPDFQ